MSIKNWILIAVVAALWMIWGVTRQEEKPYTKPQTKSKPSPEPKYIKPAPPKTAFALIPAGKTFTFNSNSFEFQTRACPYINGPKGKNRISIKLKSLQIQDSELILYFVVTNRYDVTNCLLFSRTDSKRYSERLYINDEKGKKYHAINGFEGAQIKKFNSSASQLLIPANSSVTLSARFPMVDKEVKEITFQSPGLHGHQGGWWWKSISVHSNELLTTSEVQRRRAAKVQTPWVERKVFNLERGDSRANFPIPPRSCIVIMGQSGMGMVTFGYVNHEGREMHLPVVSTSKKRKAKSATLSCVGSTCKVDLAAFPNGSPHCSEAYLFNP